MSFAAYLITDPAYDVLDITRAALASVPPGSVAVMARDKTASARELATLGRGLLPICARRGAPLLIGGRCDVALAIGADGVHLPDGGLRVADARELLGPSALIGVSRHAARSQRGQSPDFVTLSPIRAMPNKAPPLGVEGFEAMARTYAADVYALGGVDPGLTPELVRAGACGVAVIRAVYAAADPAAALAGLVAAVHSARTWRKRGPKR